ncbi:MAG TPA: hypothetical protein VK698_04980 [Kofleriaceae bacterium]|nr:hypothetical protein [Kofleriaceae bacterium]
MTSKRRVGKAPPEERTGTTTPLEWAAALLGLAVVLAALAVLVQQAVSGGGGSPIIATEVIAIERAGTSYRVEVRVVNRGERTAGQLKIEGTIDGTGGEPETSDTVLDYLPPHSRRPVILLFTRDPRRNHLAVRAVSFADP